MICLSNPFPRCYRLGMLPWLSVKPGLGFLFFSFFQLCSGGPKELLEDLLDMFCITVYTNSDIEEKQVEQWKGKSGFCLIQF